MMIDQTTITTQNQTTTKIDVEVNVMKRMT